MKKIRILAIVGSLRKDSMNRQLALAAKDLIGDEVEFDLLEYGDLPYMNQDIEFPVPPEVKRVREAVKAADGIWFFTPEYNHSVPGVLKNLIDWLSRRVSETEGQVLSKKPAAISGITNGMSGTGIAQDHLVTLISLLNMKVMNFPRLTIPKGGEQLNSEGKLVLVESKPFLEKQTVAFLKFIEKQVQA
ncbi:NAD(P)H-dependent oxidoreductase [Eubacteriaceae bacterium ES3]|nr:NAD(P)H-dependent oxidoreductase [Eubacteriaceae bacterium ES3]